jgi:hypothetical protein
MRRTMAAWPDGSRQVRWGGTDAAPALARPVTRAGRAYVEGTSELFLPVLRGRAFLRRGLVLRRAALYAAFVDGRATPSPRWDTFGSAALSVCRVKIRPMSHRLLPTGNDQRRGRGGHAISAAARKPPAPPEGLSAAERAAWRELWASPVSALWASDDVPTVIRLIRLRARIDAEGVMDAPVSLFSQVGQLEDRLAARGSPPIGGSGATPSYVGITPRSNEPRAALTAVTPASGYTTRLNARCPTTARARTPCAGGYGVLHLDAEVNRRTKPAKRWAQTSEQAPRLQVPDQQAPHPLNLFRRSAYEAVWNLSRATGGFGPRARGSGSGRTAWRREAPPRFLSRTRDGPVGGRIQPACSFGAPRPSASMAATHTRGARSLRQAAPGAPARPSERVASR